MQIVIPMSGTGQRFLDAGYTDPKPLIVVDGKPMIAHVVDLFPGENNFIFICNHEHLEHTPMGELLRQVAPACSIVGIPPHKKGPVFAVTQALDLLNDNEEIIVNYCDFAKYWDYEGFLAHTRERRADGAVTAYRGFHPHMLGMSSYAFMREEQQWMLEIKEKESFTNDRIAEYASDGTYYFRKGSFLKAYFRELLAKGIAVGGEYYVSLVYNLLLRDGLKVSIFEIEHMLQWGTPRDLEEYIGWSNYFRTARGRQEEQPLRCKGVNLIPLAGRGQRFVAAGYDRPKPLIDVMGEPMIIRAARSLPYAPRNIFVCLGEHLDNYPLDDAIRLYFNEAKIVRVNTFTEGQACTCEVGLDGEDPNASLLIGACDNVMVWDRSAYDELLADETVEAIVWSFRRHSSSERNPSMYGWLAVNDKNEIEYASVKRQISDDPYNDHAIAGAFYFRKTSYFTEALQQLYRNNIRINNEFYVDSIINELIAVGRKVKVFQVDNYVCWGTPQDLRTYQYWQRFFSNCAWHPYESVDETFGRHPLL